MTLTKKHYTIIAVVIGLIAVWYFFLRKKPVESNFKATIPTKGGNQTDVIVMCVPPRTLAGGGFNPYKCVGKGLADEEPIYKS